MGTTIWQKIDNMIGTKIPILRNSGRIIVVKKTVNVLNDTVTETEAGFDVFCQQPERVQKRIIDNSLVYAGDMQVTIDAITLKRIYEEHGNDVREWNETSGFLESGTDCFEFCGIRYEIRSIIPNDFMNNEAGEYTLILRGIANP